MILGAMRLRSLSAPLDRDVVLAVANTRHGRDARRPIAPAVAEVAGGFDRLRSSAETVRFLHALGVATPDTPPGREQLLRLKTVREAVRALAEGDAAGYARRLRRLLAGATFRIDGDVLRPVGSGWEAFIAGLLPIVADLRANDERLKVCHNASCGWVFIDATTNRAQVWCGVQGCGPRTRVRRFRRRRRNARTPVRS